MKLIRKLKSLPEQMEASVTRVYRERNKVADGLANQGRKDRKFLIYTECQLPHVIKGLLKLDLLGMPRIRCKRY
ncbi:hypothetical protein LguiA_014257 [Lonicera macranthoides]